jgi:hypothetical protein
VPVLSGEIGPKLRDHRPDPGAHDPTPTAQLVRDWVTAWIGIAKPTP